MRSTALRQAIILLFVFAVISTITWLGTYALVVRSTNSLVEQRLEALMLSAKESLSASAVQLQSGHYLAILQSDAVVDGSLPTGFSLLGKSAGYHYLESPINSDRTDFVILVHDTNTHRFVAAENIERLEETTDILLLGLQISLLASLLAAMIASVLIARYNQGRLNKINRALVRVSRGNLQTRVSISDDGDDLGQLAEQINNTIARLEATMAQTRVQSANIAHDLRTPLARLRALLEERHTALIRKNMPVSADALADALEQIDRIVDTFNALLRIARIESGARKSSFIIFPLAEVINSVQGTFGPVIEDRHQSLVVTKINPGTITGDPDMIIQMLGNLIQNALRYGHPRQQISLAVDELTLTVSDQGDGVPIEERDRVLQPMYQRDSQRQSEGYGLGLAMVNAICQLHDAKLTMANCPSGGGFSVIVKFPEPLT